MPKLDCDIIPCALAPCFMAPCALVHFRQMALP